MASNFEKGRSAFANRTLRKQFAFRNEFNEVQGFFRQKVSPNKVFINTLESEFEEGGSLTKVTEAAA